MVAVIFVLLCFYFPVSVATPDSNDVFDRSCDPSSGISTVGGITQIGGPASNGCESGYTCATRAVVLFEGLEYPFGCVDDNDGLLRAAAEHGVADKVQGCADAAFKGLCTEQDQGIGDAVIAFCCKSCGGDRPPTPAPTPLKLPDNCTDSDSAITAISGGTVRKKTVSNTQVPLSPSLFRILTISEPFPRFVFLSSTVPYHTSPDYFL